MCGRTPARRKKIRGTTGVSRHGRFFFSESFRCAADASRNETLIPTSATEATPCVSGLRSSPWMLSAFVPRCLAVIKRIHDALPARVQAVTDAWPSEVLVTAVVVTLLLNIYFFLWNVKAHESAKTRRSKRAAGKKSR